MGKLKLLILLFMIFVENDGFFWSTKSSPQVDLTHAEVYEHPLSASSVRKSHQSQAAHDRHRRQAYPVFSSSGAEGGLTIEAQRDAGPWGEWTIQKECSRTCGGGVQIETRQCQGGGCIGPPKRYVSCQTEPCPEGTGPMENFRNEQCAKFNDKPLEGRYFKWRAYNKGSNKCELLCIPEGENFYYKWMDKVIDGTKCDTMSDDICVEGYCLPLGCDGKLGSTVKQDKCLVCGGDGTGCKTMQGLFDHQNLELGYHDIITIPTGATSVIIQERKPTNNYLTLKNETGHYFLNGNWKIDFPQTLEAAGTFFEYERTRQNGLSFEKLSAKGPLNEPLIVGLLHQTENTGIQYEYSIKLDVDKPYIYMVDDWGECSVTCGQGIQERKASCVDSLSKAPVAEELCANASLPELNRTCNTEDCDAEWFIGEWEECSETCGSEGLQYRVSYCHQVNRDGTRLTVDDAKCVALSERPPVKQSCNRFPCPEWHAGPWSSCSKPCGDAEQFRSTTCRSQKEGEEGKLLADKACNATGKPEDKRECNLGPCEGLKWVTSEWLLCDRCNDTTETRNVTCEDPSGRRYPDDKCSGERPLDTRECATQPPCLYRWHSSQWSECSTVCGHGHQTRAVVCTYEYQRKLHIIDDFHCDPKMRVNDTQNCTNEAECTGTYYTTQWSKCTEPCGGGTQMRTVVCLDYDYKIRTEMCDELNKPPENQECNVDPCIYCNDTEFGCCPDGNTTATGPYLQGCSNCSLSEFGCCPDNVTEATGPDFEGCKVEEIEEGSGEEIMNKTAECVGSEFGCCPDGMTAATGPDQEGCLCNYTNAGGETVEIPCVNATALNDTLIGNGTLGLFNETETNETEIHCSKTEFGCCPDWYTPAAGANFQDCPPIETGNCNDTKYGCCPDELTLARGPDFSGCGDPECAASRFGCCKDRRTIAFGPHYKGCERSTLTCETSQYGCCPDGETAALGLNGKGCQEDCRLTRYGCCPDGTTTAKGPSNQGCGCVYSQFGCCPDGVNAANGPNYYGCPETCATSYYGCCPDGKTPAGGPSFEGCPCRYTKFGCCPDGETAARGPKNEGCDDCRYAKYGCCQDGTSKATGPNYQGCFPLKTTVSPRGPVRPEDIAACTLPSSIGEVCGAYQLKYHYSEEGYCRPFWYGGCGGNANRFDSEEQCRATCIEPPGDTSAEPRPYPGPQPGAGGDVCQLSQDTGPCREFQPLWYYDKNDQQCKQFFYGGCQGNDNRFTTREDCERRCKLIHFPLPETVSSTVNVCDQPAEVGTCRGRIESYYFDKASGKCQIFYWGGCGGNANRFKTEDQCEAKCGGGASTGGETGVGQPRQQADTCSYPKDPGTCDSYEAKWFYNSTDGTCGRFYYGGCHGNPNRFDSLHDCMRQCAEKVDPCSLPAVHGPCGSKETRYHWDRNSRTCKEFTYGGCLGNSNNFRSEDQCRQRCTEGGPRIPLPRPGVIASSFGDNARAGPQSAPLQNVVHPEFEAVCSLPKEVGPCKASMKKFFYDSTRKQCVEFNYGGCRGNRNRFDSMEDCKSYCETSETSESAEHTDQTPSGSPTWETAAPTSAETQAPSVHHDDICSLPSDSGPCTHESLKRFYFDIARGECREFTYGGCVGNHNNFPTEESCRAYCSRHMKPYKGGLEKPDMTDHTTPIPSFTAPQTTQVPPTVAMPTSQGAIQLQRWRNQVEVKPHNVHHHAGIAKPTSASTLPELCRQPKDAGTCFGESLNFYYDWDKGKCMSFSYTGCGGNTNRFQSEETCERACGQYRDQDVCSLQYDEGPCRAKILKWRFDSDTGKCVKFSYGGCDGNGNRFSSKEECESLCRQEGKRVPTVDTCSLPQFTGPCNAAITRYYFNKTTGQCMSFIYGGCQGNENNFKNQEACERKCLKQPTNKAALVLDDVCSLGRDAGPCNDLVSQWYFDKQEGECKLFTYGGCRGNGNRFNDRTECESRCKHSSTSARLTASDALDSAAALHKPPVVQLVNVKQGDETDVLLHCHTVNAGKHDEKTEVLWFKDGQAMNETEDSRLKIFGNGTLKLAQLQNSDAGGYSCSLKNSGGIVSIPLNVQTQGTHDGGIQARPNCTRDLGVTDCRKVVISGLCRHKYYGPACCQSCTRFAMSKRARHRRMRQR